MGKWRFGELKKNDLIISITDGSIEARQKCQLFRSTTHRFSQRASLEGSTASLHSFWCFTQNENQSFSDILQKKSFCQPKINMKQISHKISGKISRKLKTVNISSKKKNSTNSWKWKLKKRNREMKNLKRHIISWTLRGWKCQKKIHIPFRFQAIVLVAQIETIAKWLHIEDLGHRRWLWHRTGTNQHQFRWRGWKGEGKPDGEKERVTASFPCKYRIYFIYWNDFEISYSGN